MPEQHYHRHLRLRNFTVFRDAKFDFVDGINAFIGENGSGKTHLLKILFAFQLASSREIRNGRRLRYNITLSEIFQIDDYSELVRLTKGVSKKIAFIDGFYGDQHWKINIPKKWGGIETEGNVPDMSRPIFIPSVDMMGHTRRFLTTYDEYNIDFDLTHRDIVSLLLSPEKRSSGNGENASLMNLLQDKLGGEVVEEQERFYLKTADGLQPMPLVAEGLRKIATLYQLLKNGLIQPGTTLFWDEPEVNLNPVLMDEVIKVLLELSRQGVQIFLATHSYHILKELEVQSNKEDSLKFFALDKKERGTEAHPANNYLDLHPNLIEDQYSDLYNRGIKKRIAQLEKPDEA